jgi:myxalamid-type polyketide synthase MxaE and MxaD
MALELHRRLETSLGERLPKTLVWRHPTVAALSTYLLDRLQQATELEVPAVRARPVEVRSEQDALATLLGLGGQP